MTDRLSKPAKWRALLTSGLLAVATLGAAQTGPIYHFFKLGDSQITRAMAENIARQMNLSPQPDPNQQFPGEVFVNGDGKTQGVLIGLNKAGFIWFETPDLGKLPGNAPLVTDAARAAVGFFSKNGFFAANIGGAAQGFTSESNVWTRSDADPLGNTTKRDVIRTIRFSYKADGLVIQGPTYMFGADVTTDATGLPQVVGFSGGVRPLVSTDIPVRVKTDNQIARELAMNLRELQGNSSLVPAVQRKQLIYFEQGKTWVQPAWLFDVMTVNGDGVRQPEYVVIPLATNSPEPISIHFEFQGFPPGFVNPLDGSLPPPPSVNDNVPPPLQANDLRSPSSPLRFNGAVGPQFIGEPSGPSISQHGPFVPAAFAAAQANPVLFGEYIVREDHPCWLNDASAMWSSFVTTNIIAPWLSQKARVDYYWDYRWLWEPDPGPPAIGDNSRYYPGHVHFALIEGHGAPYIITSYKDYGDVIHLNQISPGYGTYGVSGERLCYIMWQSCDVIPEPGHPYEADFVSPHSAFDIWWGIFKGMRANYGYRTLMHICNGVGWSFGLKIGLGSSNLWSWLESTDHSAFHHSGGLDYGSAVLVSGHEGDRIYDNTQLPPPGSLTMWWIHA